MARDVRADVDQCVSSSSGDSPLLMLSLPLHPPVPSHRSAGLRPSHSTEYTAQQDITSELSLSRDLRNDVDVAYVTLADEDRSDTPGMMQSRSSFSLSEILAMHAHPPLVGASVVGAGATHIGSSSDSDGRSMVKFPKQKSKLVHVAIPSRGSKNHWHHKCRPCKFMNTPAGCPHGVLCNFCHLPHDEPGLIEPTQHRLQRTKQARKNGARHKSAFYTEMGPRDTQGIRHLGPFDQNHYGESCSNLTMDSQSSRLPMYVHSHGFGFQPSVPLHGIDTNPTEQHIGVVPFGYPTMSL